MFLKWTGTKMCKLALLVMTTIFLNDKEKNNPITQMSTKKKKIEVNNNTSMLCSNFQQFLNEQDKSIVTI